ncbi:MAG: hypothetical protein ACLFR0_01090 [Alphaproteobacteria bacterium]
MHPIRAEFLKNARGDAFIRFFDPAYVRADHIVLDRPSKSLYAVLHEQEHFLGNLDEEMLEAFSQCEEIHLTGLLSGNKALNLKAPLSVVNT